jgi:hypothetical protein
VFPFDILPFMNAHILDCALLFFIELIEANIQKGATLNELVANLSALKKHYPLIFWLLHTSLFYCLFFAIVSDGSTAILLTIVGVKSFDLIMKLKILRQIKALNAPFDISRFLGMPNIKITPFIRYSGAVVYTLMFYAAY